MTKVHIPKDYTFYKAFKVSKPNITVEEIFIWYTLKALEEHQLLPKNYFTRFCNGNICYKTAKKYAIRTWKNADRPFDIRIIKDNNEYYVITFLKIENTLPVQTTLF